MRTFYVSWTYIANFSDRPIRVEAESAAQAAEKVAAWYLPEFRQKATITVYVSAPVFTLTRGEP